jgi:hypothetical protein
LRVLEGGCIETKIISDYHKKNYQFSFRESNFYFSVHSRNYKYRINCILGVQDIELNNLTQPNKNIEKKLTTCIFFVRKDWSGSPSPSRGLQNFPVQKTSLAVLILDQRRSVHKEIPLFLKNTLNILSTSARHAASLKFCVHFVSSAMHAT